LKDQRPADTPSPEVLRELNATVPSHSTHALVLSGVRRAGKSVLQTQLMAQRRDWFYCNFEDTRLFGLSPQDFPTFLSVLDEMVPRKASVFLDEVQEVPAWQRLVRTLLDRGRTVCVTGSNASLLGRELGSKLTGRHLTFEVFPFSYSEYLEYRRLKPGRASLMRFLDDGGFPAFLREGDPKILQELLRDVVQRDVAARHGLRETRHVMNVLLFLLANTGQPISMHRLTKSLAVPTVAQTSRYLDLLEDAYLLFALPKFSPSFKQRVVAPNKYYAVDNGLRRANSTQTTPDVGHRLENAVFLTLRRRGVPVWYASEKDRWECDFLTDTEAIQVCAELTPFNRDRELDGAVRGAALPGRTRRPLVLTLDQRDRVTVGNVAVEVLPAWAWMASRPVI
jgi:predicted AAA+ superfamily ATPase